MGYNLPIRHAAVANLLPYQDLIVVVNSGEKELREEKGRGGGGDIHTSRTRDKIRKGSPCC